MTSRPLRAARLALVVLAAVLPGVVTSAAAAHSRDGRVATSNTATSTTAAPAAETEAIAKKAPATRLTAAEKKAAAKRAAAKRRAALAAAKRKALAKKKAAAKKKTVAKKKTGATATTAKPATPTATTAAKPTTASSSTAAATAGTKASSTPSTTTAVKATASTPTTTTTTAAATTTTTSAPTTTTTAAPAATSQNTSLELPSKASCPYSAASIATLAQFDSLVGSTATCAQVYGNSSTTWAQFEKPWFINYVNQPNLNWSAWATTPGTSRQLVITINFFPTSVNNDDWLDEGAAGDFEQYDQGLAETLVNAGLGNAIIRIAPEANGTWYNYSLGSTQAQWAEWDQLYANTVTAMRAVPGANFAFDWTVSAGYRALPLSEIYPGDNVVDIIGMDVYDSQSTSVAGTTGAARWNYYETAGDGINTILNFAKTEDRPVSIAEWGVATTASGGGGDDPTFVDGIASVVRNNPVVYQSYFFNYGNTTELEDGPLSLAAYQAHFGANGDSVNYGTDSW